MAMRIIPEYQTNPYFNLAAEEYLLEHEPDDVFMIWRNAPSVIIGRNQNTWSEVNVPFTEENKIAVVRRLTGGGAVFHDLGNVNFSFLTDAPAEGGLDFTRFITPILTSLSKLGIDARQDGRNDILVGERKISGNAQTVFLTSGGKRRLLHHGTLLFSADMSKLAGALLVRAEKLAGKGVSSVKSRVANLAMLPEYTGPREAKAFGEAILLDAALLYGCGLSPITPEETAGIAALAAAKYETWDWNFGFSPVCDTKIVKKFPFGLLEIYLSTDHGRITGMKIRGDYFGEKDPAGLEEWLTGCRLTEAELMGRLGQINPGLYIAGITAAELAGLLIPR